MIRSSTTAVGLWVVVLHFVLILALVVRGHSDDPASRPVKLQVSVVTGAGHLPGSSAAGPPTVRPYVASEISSQRAVTFDTRRNPIETTPVSRAAASVDPGGREGESNGSERSGSTRSGPRVDAGFGGNRLPDYPALSRRLREQGTVALRVMITPDGRAGEVQILQSSGHPRLDQSASEAIRQWRFNPASEDGKPVSAWYEWRWTFRLN